MSHEFSTVTMNDIQHELLAKILNDQRYGTIDQNSLVNMVEKIKDLIGDVLRIWYKFKEIYKAQKVIQHEKPKEDTSEEVQRIAASTSTAMQQNTENDGKSEENSFFTYIDRSMKIGLSEYKMIKLLKQEMAKNIPSKVVNIQNTIQHIRCNQFYELMTQDEMLNILCQLNVHGESYFSRNRTDKRDHRMRLAMLEEYFWHRIQLINALLNFEIIVLRMKLEREQMTTNLKAVVTNVSSKINIEIDRLVWDNGYLYHIQSVHLKEISRIFLQLQFYCDTYNMPHEDKIITHRDFIIQKIGKIKKYLELNEEVVDSSLQKEEDATNVETNDGETPDMSSKVESVKSRLMENNNNLRNIAMKHQDTIIRVCAELKNYFQAYGIKVQRTKEEEISNSVTNTSSISTTKLKLQSRSIIARDEITTFQKELINIHDQLEMYHRKHDMPNEDVTIFIHNKPYNPTKMHDDESELLKENEYLAFIAMMHLEKIREVCVFLKMQLDRFNKTTEEVNKDDYILNQSTYVSNEISVLEKDVVLLNKILKDIEDIYKGNE